MREGFRGDEVNNSENDWRGRIEKEIVPSHSVVSVRPFYAARRQDKDVQAGERNPGRLCRLSRLPQRIEEGSRGDALRGEELGDGGRHCGRYVERRKRAGKVGVFNEIFRFGRETGFVGFDRGALRLAGEGTAITGLILSSCEAKPDDVEQNAMDGVEPDESTDTFDARPKLSQACPATPIDEERCGKATRGELREQNEIQSRGSRSSRRSDDPSGSGYDE